jgi:ferredoxin
MKVSVDEDRCVSSGQCVRSAAEAFDQRDEDGVVVLLNDSPSADLAEKVRTAAAACPAQAIFVEE